MSLRINHFLRCFVATVCVLQASSPVRGEPTDPPAPKGTRGSALSLSQYAATDDFFAACYLRPPVLAQHQLFESLCFDGGLRVPPTVTLQRLNACGVVEAVVFAGVPSTPPHGAKRGFQLAAAARFSKPIDLSVLREQWNRSSVLASTEPSVQAEPEEVQIGDNACLRVPAGTFLEAPRVHGSLAFTDRMGQPSDVGLNIGDIYPYRGYVEGATDSSAVFTFKSVSPRNLIDNQLPLMLRLNSFRTYDMNAEYCRGQLILRNPASGLQSVPLHFKANSYVQQQFNIPNQVQAVDVNGNRRQVDLMKDLVSNGALEVVLQGSDRLTYLGVGKYDLSLRTNASEYVCVRGQDLVVAQSSDVLKSMLDARTSQIASDLSRTPSDLQVVVRLGGALPDAKAGEANDVARRNAFADVLRTLSQPMFAVDAKMTRPNVWKRWVDSIVSLEARGNVNGDELLQIKVQLTNPAEAAALRASVATTLFSARKAINEQIESFIVGDDARGALMSLVFGGASMRFPRLEASAREVRSLLESLASDLLASVSVGSDGSAMEVHITQLKVFEDPPRFARFLLAWLQEKHARHLFDQEQFDSGLEAYARVTAWLPDIPQLRFRRAHHLAYNTSIRFDGYAARYAWVRRGIDVLLDGAERDPTSLDSTWMAAKFIGHKIGLSDDRDHYRRLFAQDKVLHQRLGKLIDLEPATSATHGVEPWRVARLLYEHCIKQRVHFGATTSIPSHALFSGPANAQGNFAASLDAAGRWDDAAAAWKEAERMYQQLAVRPIQFESAEVKLRDTTKAAEKARASVNYDYWVARCTLEQSPEVRAARKQAREAEQLWEKGNPIEAFQRFEQSLLSLSKELKKRPEEMHLIAHAFRLMRERYQQAAKATGDEKGDEVNDALMPILKAIELSSPPLLDHHLSIPMLEQRETP